MAARTNWRLQAWPVSSPGGSDEGINPTDSDQLVNEISLTGEYTGASRYQGLRKRASAPQNWAKRGTKSSSRIDNSVGQP